jgi:cysteine-rich repeat protein
MTMPRRALDWKLAVWFCLALVVGACFGGGFAQGLACEIDADCGPRLRCIEGYCGGLGDPALCGNGLRDEGEECDDGNLNDGDGCDAECRLPAICGDGEVEQDETCDDGNAVESDECTTKCTLSPEGAPTLELNLAQIKQFEFSWEPVLGAEHYQLFERVNEDAEFVRVGEDIEGNSYALTVPLHFRANASYKLSACSALRCVESEVVDVVGTLAEAVGYFKASNTGDYDSFGVSVALSEDGNTLAVGADGESSLATGIDGDQDDDSATYAGAVYVFVRNDDGWSQQAYVKASNTDSQDQFGGHVALSRDGNTLAVGALGESSNATDIGGDQDYDYATGAGAVYVFVRTGEIWTQQAYVKASNTFEDEFGFFSGDGFGFSVALSGDGSTLAVGAVAEDSASTVIDAKQDDDTAMEAGAVYVFVRTGVIWSQQAYVKASNTGSEDLFGFSVALSGDGATLAVGAVGEDSDATDIGGGQDNDLALDAGAVYVYVRTGEIWKQQTYVKASNTGAGDQFGVSVALSGDGDTLAIGAHRERSQAMGIDGDQDNDSAEFAGAAYLMIRRDGQWSQQAYVKASNTKEFDGFGTSVALSGDGNILAVGADGESSHATGINGDQDDVSTAGEGAVYVFVRTSEMWSQRAYVKPPLALDRAFSGSAVALSGDGEVLASGAPGDVSSNVGVGGGLFDDSSPSSGAVYAY